MRFIKTHESLFTCKHKEWFHLTCRHGLQSCLLAACSDKRNTGHSQSRLSASTYCSFSSHIQQLIATWSLSVYQVKIKRRQGAKPAAARIHSNSSTLLVESSGLKPSISSTIFRLLLYHRRSSLNPHFPFHLSRYRSPQLLIVVYTASPVTINSTTQSADIRSHGTLKESRCALQRHCDL